jgi:hypothetical protein
MAYNTETKTFSIDIPALNLNAGQKLSFKLRLSGSSTNDFTASISNDSLSIGSLSAATGYASTTCNYFDSASISSSAAAGSGSSTIVFSRGLSSFYNRNYQFNPNPLTGSQNSLYNTYGDVDYPFVIYPQDIIITYLSDNTYVESRVLNVTSSNSLIQVTVDTQLSNLYVANLESGSFQKFLLLTRKQDETNAYLTFKKREGDTSYGFLIPNNISPEVLNNIDTITKEVKQKLLADQSGITINTF